MNEFRYADVEFREADNGLGTVAGTLIRYGDRAKIGRYLQEEFRPGSLTKALAAPDIFVNRMHQPEQLLGRVGAGLTLDDSEERLAFTLELPSTTLGKDTAYELRSGILRGASIEFVEIKARDNGNVRVIEEARLHSLGGFAIVHVPAYPASIAAMQRWDEYNAAHGLVVPDPEAEPVTTQKSRRYFVMV